MLMSEVMYRTVVRYLRYSVNYTHRSVIATLQSMQCHAHTVRVVARPWEKERRRWMVWAVGALTKSPSRW